MRVVYDGTASGFNDLIWVPSFSLPTVETLLRGTGPNTWMADLDIAEQFLNFNLDSYASQFVGIDLSKLFPEELTEDKFTLWERYIRCAMGLKNSPNHAYRATLIAEEFLTSFPTDVTNLFHYIVVALNLPGTENYQPSLPWFRLLDSNNNLATILVIYVDDERIHSSSHQQALAATRQVSSR